jgi:hypothetical protein
MDMLVCHPGPAPGAGELDGLQSKGHPPLIDEVKMNSGCGWKTWFRRSGDGWLFWVDGLVPHHVV